MPIEKKATKKVDYFKGHKKGQKENQSVINIFYLSNNF